VFADTSAFIAAYDPRDQEHEVAGRLLKELIGTGARLLTTNFILDETLTWFRRDPDARENVGRAILESALLDYVRLEESDERRAWNLCLKLRDKDFSFTDLTSFAVMERLKLREVFTFDDDFRRYGRFEVIS
jgi:uncharacterized protein